MEQERPTLTQRSFLIEKVAATEAGLHFDFDLMWRITEIINIKQYKLILALYYQNKNDEMRNVLYELKNKVLQADSLQNKGK